LKHSDTFQKIKTIACSPATSIADPLRCRNDSETEMIFGNQDCIEFILILL